MKSLEVSHPINLLVGVSLVLAACSTDRQSSSTSIDEEILKLPTPAAEMYIQGINAEGPTLANKSAVLSQLTDYCNSIGCDPGELVKRISIVDYPDPLGRYHMITEPSEDYTSTKMTIYSTFVSITNQAPYLDHEFTHLDTVIEQLPDDVIQKMGLPGKVYTVGFGLLAPEMDKEKGGLSAIEEAAADAVMQLIGQQKGVYYEGDVYKKSGLFLLRVAEKYGVLDQFVELHRNSDLFGFLELITGKQYDLNGFMALYQTVEEMQLGQIDTLEEAERRFGDLLKQMGMLDNAKVHAFFRLPWDKAPDLAYRGWKRILRADNPSRELALVSRKTMLRGQQQNLEATLRRRNLRDRGIIFV